MIKAGSLQVYYERTGKGEAILLLHAGLQDHSMWKEQVNELSGRFEVITPDLPFHGQTTGIDTNLLAQDLLKILLDSLHLQKVSVAGLSMGAAVAQDFIIAYPERVNKAILISAGVNGYEKINPIDSLSMNWYKLFSEALARGDTARAARQFTRAWGEGIYRPEDSATKPVSEFVYKTTLQNLRVHKMGGWPVLKKDPPALEKLGSVKVPVLIIEGDKDLPYISKTSQYLKMNIPGAKHIVIRDVAHMLNMEKPGELNKIMLDFLQ
jgi:pimeloyl-ACP methyl ester carboxylesterase